MALMVQSWWFVMFVMVFVVESIRICDGFYCFLQQGYVTKTRYSHKPLFIFQQRTGVETILLL